MDEFSAEQLESKELLSDKEKVDLARIGLDEQSFERLLNEPPENEGTTAVTFHVRHNDEDVVIKKAHYDRQDLHIERELVTLRLLRKGGSTTHPELKAYIPSRKVIIETKALGENPKEFDHNVLRSMALALGQIHQPVFRKYGKPLSARKIGNQLDYLSDGVEALMVRIGQAHDVPPATRQSLATVVDINRRLADQHQPEFSGENFSLIHFDLHPDNIFWDQKDQKITLVDWGSASIGDPAMDVEKFFFKSALTADQQQEFLQTYVKQYADPGLSERMRVYHDLVRVNSILWRYQYLHGATETGESAKIGVRLETMATRLSNELKELGIT